MDTYERVKTRVVNRQPDEWFIPMVLYLGNYSIGMAQANWNFLQALYELEVMTTARAFKIGKESHDLLHLCGRHAPMQGQTLASFMGRVVHSPEVWRDVETPMKEWIRDFIYGQGVGFQAMAGPRTRISALTWDRTRRSYRRDPSLRPACYAPITPYWPFAAKRIPEEHEMLHAIDGLTRGLPEQWRQDVCQDLVVAVLSGDVTLDNLRDALPKHVREVYKMHPIKYGPMSLDAPIGHDSPRTLNDTLSFRHG